MRTVQLIPPQAAAADPQAQQLRRAAGANLQHQSARVLPARWLAALNDGVRQGALAAAAKHLAAGVGETASAVWCVGGLGPEALHLAHAAAAAAATAASGGERPQQQQLSIVVQADDQLTFNLIRQLAAVKRAVAGVLLASAVGPSWAPVAAAQRQLRALAAAMLPGCVVAPLQVRAEWRLGASRAAGSGCNASAFDHG